MKKTTILIFTIVAIIVFALSTVSCSGKSTQKTTESNSTTFSDSNTEQGSFELSTHLTPEEPSESQPEEVTTEKEIDAITEQEIAVPIESLRFTSYGNGTCGVVGVGSCRDLFIVIPERSPDGDIVTSIEEKAFYGNREIKAIEIPSTVSDIGSMAFSNCSALVYISVDNSNKSFMDKDGVLYSKDGSTLLSYPAACGSSDLYISANVTKIADMAFYGCDTLEQIHYVGTLSDWGKINIGDMNYGLFTASVTCNAGK